MSSQSIAEDVFLCGCGGFLRQSHVDDIGTAWFKCDKCERTESLTKLERNREQSLEALKTISADLTKPEKPEEPKTTKQLNKKKVNDNEEKTIATSGLYEDQPLFCEQSTGPNGENGFAIYNYIDNEVKFEPNYLFDGVNYVPLDHILWPSFNFPKGDYRVPSIVVADALFEEVRKYIYAHVEFPSECYYDVMTAWVMATYLLEKFEAIPYLAFTGPKDSGKTRALDILGLLCYRAIESPSFSTSALFRTIEKYKPTLCLDEAEIYGDQQKQEAIAVLNAGYRKGQYVLRVNTESNGIDFFSCFGFKSLASTDVFVPTVESRAILFPMRRNVRDVPLFIDKEKAAILRFQLLVYRFNVLGNNKTILQGQDKILSYLPLRHGRIAELFYPLVAVCPSEELRQKIAAFAKEVYVKRVEDEKASTEAEIVEILLSLKNKVDSGKLAVEEVTTKFNESKSEKQQWDPRSIGRWLKRLGFQSTRISQGKRAIFYDSELLNYLSKRYGYTLEKTSLTSLMSPTMECSRNVESDVSDISDVSLEVSLSLDDLTSVYWKEEFSKKQCGICGYEKETSWEAVTHKARVIAICEDCAQAFQKKQEVRP